VWNGGNPPVIMLDERGSEVHRFHSRHLPLGIAPEDEFDDTVDRIALPPGAQLIACSDGVIEAESKDAVQFGVERLVEVAATAPRGGRMPALNAALNEHLAGGPAHDDLALILIDCSTGAEKTWELASVVRRTLPTGLANWRFHAALSHEELRSTDVVARFTGTMERMGVAEGDRANLFLILSELFNNALDHGLLKLDSSLKTGECGMECYLDLRARRLSSLSEGTILVDLELDATLRKQACIRVQDSGSGFDWRARAAVGDAATHGRGIMLVRELCSKLEYLGCGNEVVARYDLSA